MSSQLLTDQTPAGLSPTDVLTPLLHTSRHPWSKPCCLVGQQPRAIGSPSYDTTSQLVSHGSMVKLLATICSRAKCTISSRKISGNEVKRQIEKPDRHSDTGCIHDVELQDVKRGATAFLAREKVSSAQAQRRRSAYQESLHKYRHSQMFNVIMTSLGRVLIITPARFDESLALNAVFPSSARRYSNLCSVGHERCT